MPQIQLLDGKKISFTESINGFELTKKISKSLEKSALIMEVDGELKDLSHKITQNSKVRIITSKDKEGLEVIRHDAAHIMAMAVQELFPGTQVTIGPVIENGFYYDFAMDTITESDLKPIQKKMQEIARKNLTVERVELDDNELREHFAANPYKIEIIDDKIGEGTGSTIYKQGDWYDLCLGPHVQNTAKLMFCKNKKNQCLDIMSVNLVIYNF